MGQTISRTSRFHEFIEYLGFDDYDFIEYNQCNDDDKDEVLLAALNDLIFRYRLMDLYDLIENHYIEYGHCYEDILNEPDLEGFGLKRIVGIYAYKDFISLYNNHIYKINLPADKFTVDRNTTTTREDIEILLDGLLYLITRTSTYYDTNFTKLCIRIENYYSNERIAAGHVHQPITINNNDNLRNFIGRISKDGYFGSWIELCGIRFNAEQGAILTSIALRPNVTLELKDFVFDDNGLTFAEGLARNNGPAKLDIQPRTVTHHDSQTFFNNICNAISDGKNTKLKELRFSSNLNESMLMSLIDMLRTNTGLISLSVTLNHLYITLEEQFCQSLHNHPTMERLFIESKRLGRTVTEKEKIQLTKPFVELVKNNSNLISLDLFDEDDWGWLSYDNDESQHRNNKNYAYDIKLIQTEIKPCLEINSNRPQKSNGSVMK